MNIINQCVSESSRMSKLRKISKTYLFFLIDIIQSLYPYLPYNFIQATTNKFFHIYPGKGVHLGASDIHPSQLRFSQRSPLTLEKNKILVNSTVDVKHLIALEHKFFSSG